MVRPHTSQFLSLWPPPFMDSSCSHNESNICTQSKRQHSYPAFICLSSFSLHLLRLGVHASLPWIPGHLGHGEDQEGDASKKEEDEGGAGASEGPGIVIFDPDCVLTLNHAFDWLSHHLQWDEGTEAWEGERCVNMMRAWRQSEAFAFRSVNAVETLTFCWLTAPTCKCKKHASGFEEVVSSFPFTGARSNQTQRPQDHEGQAEDGDGCSWDIVL